MIKLSNNFLQNLVSKLEDESTIGFLLTGSFARNEATSYSDVDLIKFVEVLPDDEVEKYELKYIENHLVSISTTTIEEKTREMKLPESAIWVVSGLRQAKILADKNDSLKNLKELAEKFVWKPLQNSADEYASYNLMGYAEEVHKILGALERKNESATLYGTIGLVLGLSKIISVQKGILIETENSFFSQLQEEMGLASKWSLYHRIACGFDDENDASTTKVRALASLSLYAETTKIIYEIIKPSHQKVINKTLAKINQTVENQII